MENLTKERVIDAIKLIKSNPELIKGRESVEYDLLFEGATYPPILVISEANQILGGTALTIRDFKNSTKIAFRKLKKLGFEIIEKDKGARFNQKIWIEKTLVEGRQDRIEGDYAMGKRLWSPIKDKRDADIYSLMRSVSKDDIILHLTNNKGFTGVSKVAEAYVEGKGVAGTDWEGSAYIIELKEFAEIKMLPRSSILNIKNKDILERIKSKHKVFYNSELNLNQGAYLTECPLELAALINEEYFQLYKEHISFLPQTFEESNKQKEDAMFDVSSFNQSAEQSNLNYNEGLITRFVASLLTKPFVILTGLSGSGKTKLAQAFAMWICERENQYCIVPVGADWTNREPLLGFPNALEAENYVPPDNRVLDLLISAKENLNKPYFLMLDEMNLSHVERYFADFLSVMETKKKIPLHSNKNGIKTDYGTIIPYELELPQNLFIIGTVNIDETTYMFSPKVLDRANVIEFRVDEAEMESFMSGNTTVALAKLESKGITMADDFLGKSQSNYDAKDSDNDIKIELLNFFNELKKVGAEFGYRTASEILRFVQVVKDLEPAWTDEQILDAAIMQKLLPKLHGSRRKLEETLRSLAALCLHDQTLASDSISLKKIIDLKDKDKVKFPISLEKIRRMNISLINNNFTSYAEA